MNSVLARLFRIKLSFKIISAFVILTAVFIASYIFALNSMKAIENRSDHMYNKNLLLIKDMASMSDYIHQLNTSVSSYLLVQNEEARSAVRERLETSKAQISDLLPKLEAADLNPQEKNKMKLFAGLWNSYYSVIDQILTLADQNDLSYAALLYEKELLPRAEDIRGIFQDVAAMNEQEADQRYRDSVLLYHEVQNTMWLITLFSLGVTFAVGWLAQRSILKPVKQLLGSFKRLEQGDLTTSIVLNRRDEFGELGNGFNRMRESLASIVSGNKQLVAALGNVSEKIAAHAQSTEGTSLEISSGLQNTVDKIKNQISSLDRDFAMIREIAEGLRHMAGSIDDISLRSEEMEESSRIGQQAAQIALETIDVLHKRTVQTESVIQKLGRQTAEIGEMAGSIGKIAKATHILALNAGIESARAGASGKGFSVIAREVSKLAENSRHESQHISAFAEMIHEDTEELLRSGRELGLQMKAGREQVDRLFESLNQMDAWISDVNNRIQDVTAAIQEIAASSEEMNTSIKRMEEAFLDFHQVTLEFSKKSEEQVAKMNEILNSVEELGHVSRLLDRSVNRFVTA